MIEFDVPVSGMMSISPERWLTTTTLARRSSRGWDGYHHRHTLPLGVGNEVTYGALLLEVGGAGLTLLLLRLSLLEKSLRNDVLLGGDRTAGKRKSEHKVALRGCLVAENCSTAAFSTGFELDWSKAACHGRPQTAVIRPETSAVHSLEADVRDA